MELIIILIPIVFFIIIVEDLKYNLKIKKTAKYYRDVNRKIEDMEIKEQELIQKEREQLIKKQEKKELKIENPRERLLVLIAVTMLLIYILIITF